VTSGARPELPAPRGPVSYAVLDVLRDEPGPLRCPVVDGLDLLEDDDAQLALTCCYELHYRSFAGVHEGWEWAPELLALRARLERAFVRRLEDEAGPRPSLSANAVLPALRAPAGGVAGPSVSMFIEERGGVEHMREFCVHRVGAENLITLLTRTFASWGPPPAAHHQNAFEVSLGGPGALYRGRGPCLNSS
jgi:hypothetical protein